MSLGRWTKERGKEPEQEGAIQGDQHGLKGDDQFEVCQGGESKENQVNGEKQVTSLYEMRQTALSPFSISYLTVKLARLEMRLFSNRACVRWF